MNVQLQPGNYVIAVSGGVDSVALLHRLAQEPGVSLTVAHFDHGIRDNSHLDRRHVQQLASKYRLPFIYDRVELGPGASEAEAREERYGFLQKVRSNSKAQALITAHHQDDLLETAVINILRGTGRKGLSSLADTSEIRRPMLGLSKASIKRYAAEQGLVWQEDSTNADTRILRNYVRHIILPKLSVEARQQLLSHIQHASVVNRAVDTELMNWLHVQPSRQTLDRMAFAALPHDVSREVMAAWLRSHGLRNFDSKMLERMTIQAKTLQPGKQIDIMANRRFLVGNDVLALVATDR